jgi:hypothetical protein
MAADASRARVLGRDGPGDAGFDGNDLWQSNLDDEGTMQRFLTTLDVSAADLIALTHRPALIEALRHPAPGVQMQTPSAWSFALVLADQGRSPELDHLLQELREMDQDPLPVTS